MDKMERNMKSPSTAGFGLIQAMIGVVIIGIMSLVFVRKTANRQDLAVAVRHISYRDQVLDYYASVANNRIAWKNTRAGVADWNSATNIALKDVDDTELIPSSGLLLSEQNIADGKILPTTRRPCPSIPASGKISINHFCLRVKKTGPTKITITLGYQEEGRTTAEMANYIIKPKERDIDHSYGITTGRNDCVKRAIGWLDFNDKRIECSAYNLIEPPCYKSSTYQLPTYSTRCSWNGAGKCPDISSTGGKTALIGFRNTALRPEGNTRCSGSSNILLAKASLPEGNNSMDSYGGIGRIDPVGRVYALSSSYMAVQPFDCSIYGSNFATQGWNSDGTHAGCKEIRRGEKGNRGPIGLTGDRGASPPNDKDRIIIVRGHQVRPKKYHWEKARGNRGGTGDDGPPGDPGPTGRGPSGDDKSCCRCPQ